MSETTKAVFLSYARENTAAAQRLAEALRSHGVEVWFDQSELRGGDAWDQKIRRQIRECTLFVPVISAHTQDRGEGYFRLEWKLAVERTHLMAEGVPFLAPVVVDDTPDAGAVVPAEFMRVQWTRLPGALPTPQFVVQIKRLLEAPRRAVGGGRTPEAGGPSFAKVTAGRQGAEGGSRPVAGQGSGMRPGLLAGAVTVVIIGVVAGWWVIHRPASSVAGTKTADVSSLSSAKASAAAEASATEDKSIAVLPFENMSDDKDTNAFFADGIHEDILTNLAHIRELRVVSRTSVMEYEHTTKKIGQIARELNVAYVLEGSVRRAGGKVRVTGQLIRAATDTHLWAEDYTRDLTAANVFDIQSELAQKIASSLQAALSPQEKNFLAQRPTENLAAYDLYLKARADRRNLTAGSVAARLQGEESLARAAVTLDPKFAAAWGELGIIHADIYFFGYDHSPARLANAREAIDTATQLAPDLPDVIRAVAEYYFHGHRDYPRAAAEYGKLVALQPNDPNSHSGLAYVQRRQGQFASAVANFRKALQLDPADFRVATNLVQTLEAGHRYDDAAEQERRVISLHPERPYEAYYLARGPFLARGSTREVEAFLAGLTDVQANSKEGLAVRSAWASVQGNYAEAVRLNQSQIDSGALNISLPVAVLAASGDASAPANLEKLAAELRAQLDREPENDRACANLGVIEAMLGHREEARRWATKATTLVPETLDAYNGPAYGVSLATVLAWTGDKDRAIAECARLLRVMGSDLNVFMMKKDARFLPLQGDPRFEALLNDPKNNQPLF